MLYDTRITLKLVFRLLMGFYVLSITPCFGQEEVNTQPPNSSHLAEYGLSPKIFNVLISPMFQEDAEFRAIYSEEITSGDKTTKEEYELVYDPFYEYGLTLRLIVHDHAIYQVKSKSKIKRVVGSTHEKYKKIRDKSILTESEVYKLHSDNDVVELGFKIQKKSLPNSLKHFHKMEGTVIIENKILDRIELVLKEPARIKGIDVEQASIVVRFQQMEAGGYLLRDIKEYYKGSKNGQPYERQEEIKIIDYIDKKDMVISEFKGVSPIVLETGKVPDTMSVKLERSLPVLGNAARKAGYELPMPYGANLFSHFQQEDLSLDRIVLNDIDLTSEILAPGGSKVTAVTNIIATQADVWILPFFNVNVMAGYMYGSTDISLALSQDVKDILSIAGEEIDALNFSAAVDGPLIGAGFTAAGGYKNLFATVNVMYINQFVEGADTEVTAMAITPLAGIRMPKIINVMAGAQYQSYDSNVSGSINAGGETLNYNVELNSTRWNFIFGLQRDFSNHFNGTIMIGPRPRPQTTVVLGYRF